MKKERKKPNLIQYNRNLLYNRFLWHFPSALYQKKSKRRVQIVFTLPHSSSVYFTFRELFHHHISQRSHTPAKLFSLVHVIKDFWEVHIWLEVIFTQSYSDVFSKEEVVRVGKLTANNWFVLFFVFSYLSLFCYIVFIHLELEIYFFFLLFSRIKMYKEKFFVASVFFSAIFFYIIFCEFTLLLFTFHFWLFIDFNHEIFFPFKYPLSSSCLFTLLLFLWQNIFLWYTFFLFFVTSFYHLFFYVCVWNSSSNHS